MARNLDQCRHCRREGEKLYLKGEKCFTDKCPVERRAYAPGQHGQKSGARMSDYGKQLREKQKVRHTYGILERQFRNIYFDAARSKGVTGERLLQILESRLDNVVYRSGLGRTRRHARQLVSHGHFLVNGQKVDIPSFRVSQHDIIDVKPKSLETTPFLIARETLGDRPVPAWLQVVQSRLRVLVHRLPERAQIDIPVQEQLIVELYSK
jgi:small subunit ribosomal protein S4